MTTEDVTTTATTETETVVAGTVGNVHRFDVRAGAVQGAPDAEEIRKDELGVCLHASYVYYY